LLTILLIKLFANKHSQNNCFCLRFIISQ